MPTHSEKQFLPHTPDQLYELVSDVEDYPNFLPWCLGLRITHRRDCLIEADMIVGFKMLREKFKSKVTLTPKERIDVEYLDGPFEYLENRWLFKDKEGGCEIDFFIDFEFRSRLLRKIMEPLFYEAVRRMVRAFETQANNRYG
ncbi:MAG: Persistence and stress-resistance toxin PasT [Alphaproteobacteria bacterium MarineAlpha11_Bin1]|nr:MAG: Persistence and stress-resistance toxin PasT [Alphaproteobacteria bacterium MarineAlpha11_Bin1]|tara:strand:- start:3349 stop:3777 length:429 start_codon:yes stop_codon:yes gene_type:complete